jgi:hypothetical protein
MEHQEHMINLADGKGGWEHDIIVGKKQPFSCQSVETTLRHTLGCSSHYQIFVGSLLVLNPIFGFFLIGHVSSFVWFLITGNYFGRRLFIAIPSILFVISVLFSPNDGMGNKKYIQNPSYAIQHAIMGVIVYGAVYFLYTRRFFTLPE